MHNDTQGLRLHRRKDYTDQALDKVIFNFPFISFYMNQCTGRRGGQLRNIDISEGIYESSFQISERSYNKIVCPAYNIQADVEDEDMKDIGFINGIIRPVIGEGLVKAVMSKKPIFNFYFEDYDSEELFMGKTMALEKWVWHTKMVKWNQKDYKTFYKEFLNNKKHLLPTWFDVKVDPDKSLSGHFWYM